MSAVLVTGASGFIGRATCAELLKRGFEVRAAVRDEASAIAPGAARYVAGDLAQPTSWQLDDIDAIVHVAGIAHELRGQNAESIYEAINCKATVRLAEAAVASGVRRFIFLSSIKVNGDFSPPDRPFRSSDAPNPRDRYARSKWNAEQGLMTIASRSGLEVAAIRPPLVYGPGVGANFLRLVRLVESGIPLPLASVHNRRNLVYVENLTDLIARCLTFATVPLTPIMAADVDAIATPDLIREIAHGLGRPAKLVPLPPSLLKALASISGQRDNVKRLLESMLIDVRETCARLGWQPPFSLKEGLSHTMAWYLDMTRHGIAKP